MTKYGIFFLLHVYTSFKLNRFLALMMSHMVTHGVIFMMTLHNMSVFQLYNHRSRTVKKMKAEQFFHQMFLCQIKKMNAYILCFCWDHSFQNLGPNTFLRTGNEWISSSANFW